MGNQISIGDQNNQQIGQNQINQPTTVPEKHGINYWMLLSIVLLTIVISGGFYIASIRNQVNNATPSQNNKGEITQSPTIVVPTETLTPTTLKPTDGIKSKDWKTYKSDKYNLEFKYPPTFTQKETLDSISLESIPQKDTISFAVDYYDNIIDQIKKLSEEEARRQSFSFLVSESEYKIGSDQSIQGQKIVLRRFLDSGGSYDEEIIYFRVGSHSFAIQTSNKKIRDQVLSTLKVSN